MAERQLIRRRLGRLAAALVVLAGVAAQAAPRVRVTTHRVPWKIARAVRLVHLSDLHVGHATDPRLLDDAIARTRALRPDLVVLTGDYVNRSLRDVPALQRLVAQLPRPCLAVLGNHDHWSGADGVRAALRRAGVQVLTNTSTVVRGAGWELTVVGVDDGYTGHHAIRQAFAGLAAPREALVLTHYPPLADAIAARGGRLILAGHTHGGHFAVPILTLAIARLAGQRYLFGWHDVGKRQGVRLYVNVGIGAGRIRARLGERAAPELALIELTPEA